MEAVTDREKTFISSTAAVYSSHYVLRSYGGEPEVVSRPSFSYKIESDGRYVSWASYDSETERLLRHQGVKKTVVQLKLDHNHR